MKTTILLADGRKLVREGLSLLLERHDDLQVVGEAETSNDVPRLLRAIPVDVVVLNAQGATHLQPALVRAMLRTRSGVKLVVLTGGPQMEFVQSLLDAGVSGCLTKESAGAELVAAVRQVMTNKIYLSPAIIDGLVSRLGEGHSRRNRFRLAPREREILAMIAAGQSTKEIAAALALSCKTIETHRRRIMEKLGRHSIAELTKYAVLEGFTSLETSQ